MFSLRSRMILGFGSVLLVGMCLLVAVMTFGIPFTTYKGSYGHEEAQVIDTLSLVADFTKDRFVRWLEERKGDAKILAESGIAKESAQRLHEMIRRENELGRTAEEVRRSLRNEEDSQALCFRLKSIQNTFGCYWKIQVVDAQTGLVVASTDEATVGDDISGVPSVTDAVQRFAAPSVVPEKDPRSGRASLVFSYAVSGSTVKETGRSGALAVAMLYVDIDDSVRPLLHEKSLGYSGDVVLVDKNVRILMPLKYPLPDGTAATVLDHVIKAKPARKSIQRDEGIAIAEDYRNVPVPAVYRRLNVTPDQPWGLVFKIDSSEAFEQLRQGVLYSFVVGLAVLAGVVGIAWLVADRIARPVRILSGASREVEDGNLSVRVKVDASDDLGGLCTTFNSMIQRIENWHATLEQEVQARTAELQKANEGLTLQVTLRRQAEQSLAAEKEKLAVTLRSIGDGVISTDTDSRVVSLNRAAEELTGWNEEETIGRPLDDVFHIMNQQTRQRCENPVAKVLQRGQVVLLANDTVLIARDGTERVLADSGAPIKDNSGAILGAVLVFRDVTEAKRAEQTLRERQQRYEALFNNMSDGVVVCKAIRDGEDFVFLDLNRAAEKMNGIDRQNLVGKRVGETSPLVISSSLFVVFQRVWRTGLPEFHAVKHYKEGRIEECRDSFVYKLPSEEIVVIYSDETDREKAEEAVKLERDNLIRIFEAMEDGVFMVGERYDIQFVNGVLERDFGAWQGRKCYEYFHGMDGPCSYCKNALIWAGQTVRWDHHIQRSGKTYDMMDTPLKDQDGSVSKLEIMRDITARIRMEEELRRSKDDLEKRVEERTAELKRTNERLLSEIAERERIGKALWESEERLQLALRSGHLGYWDWEVRAGEIVVSPEWYHLLGYGADEPTLRFDSWKDMIHADDRPRVMDLLHAHLEGRTPAYEAEYRIRLQSGEWKWSQASGKVAERDVNLRPSRMVGIFIDTTERKQAEEALRQSEERFRTIFETARDLIFLKDSSGIYTQVNPAVEILLNLPASQLVGRTAAEIFDQEASSHIKDLDERVLRGEVIEAEHTRRINGLPMTFHDIRVPLRDSAGRIIGLCGISRNITDWKKTEVPVTKNPEYRSAAMQDTLGIARLAAKRHATVMLTGESGSGKDYLARYIHEHSNRADGAYLSINCAAIPRELAESELFGHEKGAFTGALARKRGLLELAEGGTLLLNEIGELSLPLQAKLLTFLDTRRLTRVGGEKEVSVDARLVAATNRDLQKEVEAGRFRKDLFYRLNVVSITVPPLRDRREDIPLLVEEMLSRLHNELQIPPPRAIDSAMMEKLQDYHWPGNVRELRNVLERAVILSAGEGIDLESLGLLADGRRPDADWSFTTAFPLGVTLHDTTDELIKALCVEALRRCGGNKKSAAGMLGISRDTLYRYLDKFEAGSFGGNP